MTRALRIGRIFGISIEIDYTWFIIFFIVVVGLASGWFAQYLPDISPSLRWLVAGVTTILFFASVLLHELSHSIVAIRSGLKVSGITLFLFGGVSKLTEEPRSAGVEFRMALAGPLMSLFLAAVFLLASIITRPLTGGEVFATVFRWLGFVNGILAAFNLLPGFPLDGGRVLRAGLWKWMENLAEATRIAATFGQTMGFLMIIGGIFIFFTGGGFGGLWLAFIGWFLMQAAQQSYQQMMLQQTLSGITVGNIMTSEVETVPPDITLEQVVQEYIMGRNHPAFPVSDGQQVVGLLCLNDVRAVPRENWSQVTVRETAPALSSHNTISASADAWEALTRMSAENCGRLVVVDDGNVKGIISRTDLMRLIRTRAELGI